MCAAHTRIGVVGILGRMGRLITEAGAEATAVQVVAGFVQKLPTGSGSSFADAGLPGAGVLVTGPSQGPDLDVVVDFSTPEGTIQAAHTAISHKAALVSGTTGLNAASLAALDEAAKSVAVLHSPNMSVGVNLLFQLVESAAARVNPSWAAEIIEAHHSAKADAPSGTACQLAEILCSQRELDPSDALEYGRQGRSGPRDAHKVGIHAIRGGDVVGEHTVLFLAAGERLELTHRATDRRIFARGAIQAALWAHQMPPGRYSMNDMLNAREDA